jgi:hypothetical protein
MVNPNLNPFSVELSCLKCIGGSMVQNDDTNCAGVVDKSLPDGVCNFVYSPGNAYCNNCGTGLRKVVSDWIDDTTRSSVVTMYGPIEDWDISEVTNMNCIFSSSQNNFNTFNANISEWDTSAVTTMQGSTFKILFLESFLNNVHMYFSIFPMFFLTLFVLL